MEGTVEEATIRSKGSDARKKRIPGPPTPHFEVG